MPGNSEPDPDWILTQERLKHASGVKNLIIQSIEPGTTGARIGWLMRIADALDIHVRDLLD